MHRRTPLVIAGVLTAALVYGVSAAFAIEAPTSKMSPAPTTKTPSKVTLTPPAKTAPHAPSTGDASATPPQNAASQASTATPKSIAPKGTAPYALDFTMPTLGKSGCMVCHADRNLIRIKGDQYVSYYVSAEIIDASAHGPGPKAPGGVLCTGCHLDFASSGQHKNTDWKRTARQACRACHASEDDAYGKGTHAVKNTPGQSDPNADKKPLCGDCHGAHDIKRLDAAGQAALHANGRAVCGRCHTNEWANYADYYHGAAYTRGAPDAPACWDCHGAHQILPSSDRRSPTNADNLVATCSGETAGRKCHSGVNEEFVGYAGLIHRKEAALEQNWLYSFILKTKTGISATLSNIADAVRSWFV